ncbi:hypothetical protein DIPPA_27980 [Diplonema papillatum]|nr:hypothetical protein DIPPA_27980 [Diplonema papillatum]
MTRALLPVGTPVVIKKSKRRGLLLGHYADLKTALVQVGAAYADTERASLKDLALLLCVGAGVTVNGRKELGGGCVVKHARNEAKGCEGASLVRFDDGRTKWVKDTLLTVVKASHPRDVLTKHPCAGAGPTDYGVGTAQCDRCGKWPILNRGCSGCEKKLCGACLADHAYDSSTEDEDGDAQPPCFSPEAKPLRGALKEPGCRRPAAPDAGTPPGGDESALKVGSQQSESEVSTGGNPSLCSLGALLSPSSTFSSPTRSVRFVPLEDRDGKAAYRSPTSFLTEPDAPGRMKQKTADILRRKLDHFERRCEAK